ncbi:hypothetical protein J6590_024586 [Homalodisca vitripennis]|nr:hypothetical protein J6590_024586 [Homalodisca vitripennis]
MLRARTDLPLQDMKNKEVLCPNLELSPWFTGGDLALGGPSLVLCEGAAEGTKNERVDPASKRGASSQQVAILQVAYAKHKTPLPGLAPLNCVSCVGVTRILHLTVPDLLVVAQGRATDTCCCWYCQ